MPTSIWNSVGVEDYIFPYGEIAVNPIQNVFGEMVSKLLKQNNVISGSD